MGTAWFLAAAPGLEGTGFPEAISYGRPDSLTLLPLGLLPGDPALWLGWLAAAGVAASAWAAMVFAEELGASRPWSALAGLGFGFGGLTATALLEGYPYMVLNPWLPLLGLAWLRGQGARAGLWGLLCLLTSGYLAVGAGLLVLGLWRWRREHLRALWVLPLLALYVWGFASAEQSGGLNAQAQPLLDRLWTMATPLADTDVLLNGQSAALLGTVLGLSLAAPAVVKKGWVPPFRVMVLSLGLALVPLSGDNALAQALLRFPDRALYAFVLCSGALAALALTHLVERKAWTGVFLLTALAEAFLVIGLPLRQGYQPVDLPAVYNQGTGPVLDLHPEHPWHDARGLLWATNTDCFYARLHHRPIADHCLFVPGEQSPRLALSRDVLESALLGGGLEQPEGFEQLVLHADEFHPADLARLR